ncbi:MAG: shikimate dehydrogenase [Saprospiraceae bacterium]|nr:shikimate dehydrogenase [Saprospiraceae bacterium]
MTKQFGLIGFPLSHSFSKKYFADKFAAEAITDTAYDNFPISDIKMLPDLLKQHPNLIGLNVTIPYKEVVIPYLDKLAPDAEAIHAVNTILVHQNGHCHGFNSDIYGFDRSLSDLLPDGYDGGALILGSGGASKAVRYVCRQRGIPYLVASRKEGEGFIAYEAIDGALLADYRLVVNTTPLGMHPEVEQAPDLPYDVLDESNYLYDLIYNPAETRFLQLGSSKGCCVKNGLDMLVLQAERSWEIWNDPPMI